MKKQICATIDSEIDARIVALLREDRKFRNKSHLIEIALEQFFEQHPRNACNARSNEKKKGKGTW